VTRVVCVDLHAAQIQGFFNIPFDHLFARPVFLRQYLQQHFDSSACVISPDASGVERARAYSKRLGATLAIVDRRHDRLRDGQSTRLVGDVEGKDCIIVDDIIDTATTLCGTAHLLAERGARRICACVTHAVLSGDAVEQIEGSQLQEVVVTNSIPLPDAKVSRKLKCLSLGPLLGEAIKRIHTNDSVSSLFG
jgi:ribose-phosphate pyrophosphokinase